MLASPSALVLWLALVGSATTLHVGTPALCRPSAARSHPLLTVQTSSASAPTAKRCKRPGPKPVVPTLREVDLRKLDAGQRVQRQDLRGGSGNGYAVQDIRADPEVVWRHISDFAAYDRLIATVRTAQAYSPTQVIPGTGCYRFTVSRLRLCLDVRFCVDNDLRYAYWTLEQPSWVRHTGLAKSLPARSGLSPEARASTSSAYAHRATPHPEFARNAYTHHLAGAATRPASLP